MAVNGKIPVSELLAVPGEPGCRLLAAPAVSWGVLATTVRIRFGWTPRITSAGDAYRSYAIQERIFVDRYQRAYTEYAAGRVDRRVWNGVAYYRRRGTAAAAVPGTSNHGRGIAVDVANMSYNTTRFQQLSLVAANLGWSNLEGRSVNEAWHWVYTRNVAIPVNNPFNNTSSVDIPDLDKNLKDPIPLLKKDDDDMSVLVRHPNGSIALAGNDGTFELLVNIDEVEALKALELVKLNKDSNAGPSGTYQLVDGLIWDKLTAISYRKALRGQSDPNAVATSLAALLIPTIVANLHTGTGISEDQVRRTVENSIRDILGSLDD